MKRMLTACLLGSLAFAVSAQDAPPAEVDADAETQAQVESDQQTAQTQLEAEAKTQADADRNCLRYTGTHISTRALEREGKDCVMANGRVYSREDIRNTGETDMADALRKLDPAIY